MVIISSSNVGVSTTSPWRALSVTGTVGFDGLAGSTGAGSLCLDGSKQVVYNSCLASTRETPRHHSPFARRFGYCERTRARLLHLQNGDGRTRYGFIAEDAAAVDAHLATYNASGALSGNDYSSSALASLFPPMCRAVTFSTLGSSKNGVR